MVGGSQIEQRVANVCDLTPADIFIKLYNKKLIKKSRYPNWWPNYGRQEVIITTILTQQAKFIQVENSIQLLRNANIATIKQLATAKLDLIRINIKSCGFYNQKAQNLKLLCQNIINDFNNFEKFKKRVCRQWLLSQKGIGFESADAILCYACCQPVMVSDNYTKKLLSLLGFSFKNYEDMNNWLYADIASKINTIRIKTDNNLKYESVFALFHGMIVEFMKKTVNKDLFNSCFN